MRIEVPWGTGSVPVDIEPGRVAGVLGANVHRAADPRGIVRKAVTASGTGFEEFLASARSPLLVVVNDGTRPTPSAEVLAELRAHLEVWAGAPGNEIAFIVATGTHRAASASELEHVFGADLARAHAGRIVSHDAKDEDGLVHLGRTVRGTEVSVSSLLAEANSVVVINSVEPHYFAGYTGGRKSLFPGLAGYETIRGNHKLAMEPGSEPLTLEGNPVHEDLQEATALGVAGKQVYSIQLVLDGDHHIGFASAGDLEETFRAAVTVADRQYVLDIERRQRVVVASAPHPMDCDLYQANKAIHSGALAVQDGGVLIVVAQCSDGLGGNRALYDTMSASASASDALARLSEVDYELGMHQAARVAKILKRIDIWVVSSLDDEDVRAMFMTPFASVQAAVEAALEREGKDAKALFLTEASITVPRPREVR